MHHHERPPRKPNSGLLPRPPSTQRKFRRLLCPYNQRHQNNDQNPHHQTDQNNGHFNILTPHLLLQILTLLIRQGSKPGVELTNWHVGILQCNLLGKAGVAWCNRNSNRNSQSYGIVRTYQRSQWQWESIDSTRWRRMKKPLGIHWSINIGSQDFIISFG